MVRDIINFINFKGILNIKFIEIFYRVIEFAFISGVQFTLNFINKIYVIFINGKSTKY